MKTVSSSYLTPITTSKTVSSLAPMPMPCNSMHKSTTKGQVTLTTTVNKAEWLGEPTSTGMPLGKLKHNRGEYGWAEFAIPLRSLRFGAGKNKTWGVNFQRNIAKNSEVAYWASLPLGFDIKRVSVAGKVSGMELKNPKNPKSDPLPDWTTQPRQSHHAYHHIYARRCWSRY